MGHYDHYREKLLGVEAPTRRRSRSRHDHSTGHVGRRSREPSAERRGQRREQRGSTTTPRYTYPSSRPSSRPCSPPKANRLRATQRRTWPPSPMAEDERSSLAKEFNPPRITDTIENEARSRGARDQVPLILDVENYRPKNTTQAKLYRSSSLKKDASLQTPKTCLKAEAPEVTGRVSSPYVFTPKPCDHVRDSPTDSGYFSSSELEARLLAEKRKAFHDARPVPISDALRGEGRYRNSADYSKLHDSRSTYFESAGKAGNDYRGSPTENQSSKMQPNFQPSAQSSKRLSRDNSEVSMSSEGSRSHLSDNKSKQGQPRLAELKSRSLHEVRRSSESATTLPPPKLERLDTKPIAPMAAAATIAHAIRKTESDPPRMLRRDTSSGSISRPSSPTTPSYSRPEAETRSPRNHSHKQSGDYPSSLRSSAASSRAGSVVGSRPSSPSSLDQGVPSRRMKTVPHIPEDDVPGTSGLATAVSTSDFASVPPRPKRTSTTSSSASTPLPYPIDDMNLMPSEEDHRYKPRGLDEPFSASIPAHTRTPVPPTFRRAATATSPEERPRLDSRRAVTGTLPSLNTSPNVQVPRPDCSPLSIRDSAARHARPPPACPRSKPTKQYDDWYFLEQCHNFNICPTCLDANFGATSFRKYFKPISRASGQKMKCDFSSPWARLAWSLTQAQHRFDLDLIYAVAHLDATESACPGDSSDTRIWYGVVDRRGHPIENFEVCNCDVKKAEMLMPSLHGLFLRRNTAQKRKCDFRSESRRLSEYLELLSEIHHDAMAKRRSASIQPFADLAKQKAHVRECERDSLLLDKSWHFVPQLPEFTVCEECYSSVIWPAIADGSSVAARFNRTPQLLHEDKRRDRDRHSGRHVSPGFSCQLYSPRMRRIFRRSVQHGDFDYLARHAVERKEVESELSTRFAALRKKADDIDKAHGKGAWQQSHEGRGLQSQLDAVAQDWSKWE